MIINQKFRMAAIDSTAKNSMCFLVVPLTERVKDIFVHINVENRGPFFCFFMQNLAINLHTVGDLPSNENPSGLSTEEILL